MRIGGTWRDLTVLVNHPGENTIARFSAKGRASYAGCFISFATSVEGAVLSAPACTCGTEGCWHGPASLLLWGYFKTAAAVGGMTPSQWEAHFKQEWEKQEARRQGKAAEKWEVYYEALLDEFTRRATGLNRLARQAGITPEAMRQLWSGPDAYAQAVQKVFQAHEVTNGKQD